MDLYGHNPFSARRPDLADRRSAAASPTSRTSTRSRAGSTATSQPRGKRLRLFLSEFTLPTDHANYGVQLLRHAQDPGHLARDALRITRRWSRIYTFGYLGLYDDPAREGGDQVERGLLDRDGHAEARLRRVQERLTEIGHPRLRTAFGCLGPYATGLVSPPRCGGSVMLEQDGDDAHMSARVDLRPHRGKRPIGSRTGAEAQVVVDPDSPAGKEYALPLEDARNTGGTGGGPPSSGSAAPGAPAIASGLAWGIRPIRPPAVGPIATAPAIRPLAPARPGPTAGDDVEKDPGRLRTPDERDATLASRNRRHPPARRLRA